MTGLLESVWAQRETDTKPSNAIPDSVNKLPNYVILYIDVIMLCL